MVVPCTVLLAFAGLKNSQLIDLEGFPGASIEVDAGGEVRRSSSWWSFIVTVSTELSAHSIRRVHLWGTGEGVSR